MRRRPLRAGLAAVLAAGLSLGAAGCTSPRNTLGTNSSQCFRALAVAKDAVQGAGQFSGVRFLTVSGFLVALRQGGDRTMSAPPGIRGERDALCAVNYHGQFQSDDVEEGWPVGHRGAFAVVVVDAKSNKVLATLILHHPPLAFSKTLPPL